MLSCFQKMSHAFLKQCKGAFIAASHFTLFLCELASVMGRSSQCITFSYFHGGNSPTGWQSSHYQHNINQHAQVLEATIASWKLIRMHCSIQSLSQLLAVISREATTLLSGSSSLCVHKTKQSHACFPFALSIQKKLQCIKYAFCIL